MRLLLTIIVVLISLQSISGNGEGSGYRILRTGVFHGDEVVPVENHDWYGLFKTGTTYELRAVSVHTNRAYDVVVDDDGDTTGIEVSIDQPEEPLLLIQTVKPLKTGRVSTVFDDPQLFELGSTVHLGSHDLAALGEVTDEGAGPGNLFLKKFRVVMYDFPDDTRRQTLFEHKRITYDGVPSLIWAGDLDGDGQPDLLMDITDHYNVIEWALYLSSEADEGEMVKLVAVFRTTGC